MPVYVMSDIHGDVKHFFELLKMINFSLEGGDTLYVLGDVLDKGDYGDNLKLLKYCLTTPNIKLLMGNHEYYAYRYLLGDFDAERWAFVYDGRDTLREMQILPFQDKIWYRERLSRLPVYLELPQFTINGKPVLLCHAGISSRYLVLKEDGRTVNVRQSIRLCQEHDLRTSVTTIDIHQLASHYDFDCYVICGHYDVDKLYGELRFDAYVSDRYMDIDCGSFCRDEGGKLCCYCMDTSRFYYL